MTKKADKPDQKPENQSLEPVNPGLTYEEGKYLEHLMQEKAMIYKEKELLHKEVELMLIQNAWQARSIAILSEVELTKQKIELARIELELEKAKRLNRDDSSKTE